MFENMYDCFFSPVPSSTEVFLCNSRIEKAIVWDSKKDKPIKKMNVLFLHQLNKYFLCLELLITP